MKQLLRALIWPNGGKNVGLGHLRRCFSLADSLVKLGGEVFFVTPKEDISFLIASERWPLLGVTRKASQLITLLNENKMDVCIVDSYEVTSSDLYYIKDNFDGILVSIDDLAELDFPSDIIINGSAYAEKLKYKCSSDAILLLGTRFFLLHPEFKYAQRRFLRKHIEKVLITLGGCDNNDFLPKLLMATLNILPEVRVMVIVGQWMDSESLNGIPDEYRKRVIFYHQPKRMSELILAADIAISSAGQTLYELAATGTPAIGIVTGRDQKWNLRNLQSLGTVVSIGSVEENFDVITMRLEEAFNYLKDVERRANMSKLGRKAVDGLGADRVAETIFSVALKDNILK